MRAIGENGSQDLSAEVERLRSELLRANQRYSELRHRISNELQTFLILFSSQRKRANQPDFCEMCVSRICATVVLHETLDSGSMDEEASMTHFLPALSAVLKTAFAGRVEFLTSVEPDIFLDQQQAQRVGLIYTEAVVNALKHGFPGGAQGNIETTFRRVEDLLELTIANDGAIYKPSASPGCGTQFMRDIAQQLDGRLTLEPLAKGLLVRLTFPAGR